MTVDAQPRLRWLERGEGEPVILLHGLFGRMDDWEPTLGSLEAICRPLALSLPLFDPALSDRSIAGLADQVIRFMDALEIRGAVLGGNSLGGHVALQVALTAPTRVSGLILTGSSGLFERSCRRGIPHRPSREYVARRLEEVVYDRRLATAAWVAAVHDLLNTRATALRVLAFVRAARSENLARRLTRLRVPTLLVWGTEDRITPPDVGRRFHRLIPGSDLMMLARCGHMPMVERPEAFSAIAHVWIARNRLRRARGAAVRGGVR